MSNSIATAKFYPSDVLDQKLIQSSVTGVFVDNAFGAKFVGNDGVYLASRDFVGLGNYARNGAGYSQGDITVTRELYQLKMERSQSFFMDSMDIDESGITVDKLMGHDMGDYIEEHVAPEKDAYVLSSAFGVANASNQIDTFSETSPFGQLVDLVDNVGDVCGYNSENFAFVDREAYSAMRKSSEFQKMVDVANFKQGGIDLRVKRLDNTYIIPVPSARMKSAYLFHDGINGKFGFEPNTDAEGGLKNVRMLVVPKKDIALVIKHAKIRVFTPETYQPKEGYNWQYRILYDAFIKKSRRDHIFAAYSPV